MRGTNTQHKINTSVNNGAAHICFCALDNTHLVICILFLPKWPFVSLFHNTITLEPGLFVHERECKYMAYIPHNVTLPFLKWITLTTSAVGHLHDDYIARFIPIVLEIKSVKRRCYCTGFVCFTHVFDSTHYFHSTQMILTKMVTTAEINHHYWGPDELINGEASSAVWWHQSGASHFQIAYIWAFYLIRPTV